jgi:hypothetical protein
MNDYPAYDQLITSSLDVLDDVTVDRSASGYGRARSFYTARKRRFTVQHLLADDDLADFMTFYDDNRTAAVSLPWQQDGQTYTCLFGGPPKLSYANFPYTQVTVTLEEQ